MKRLPRNCRLRQIPQIIWTNRPDFYAPLTHSLALAKGKGVATFTRSTTATCWCYLENAVSGASQVLQVIPSGIPRFEGARFIASNNTWSNLLADGSVIPEATLKGVMIEVASTNLVLQSKAFSNGSWVKEASSISANAVTAPDGTLTADRLIEAATTQEHRAYQYITLSASTAYTVSIFVKASGRTSIFSKVATKNETYGGVVFNLSTVTATGQGAGLIAGSAGIIALGGGWYRCSYSVNSGIGSTSTYITVQPTIGESISYTGDGTSGVYIWGAQLEAISFASSYIPTTTATVTRNADVLTFPSAGNVIDSSVTVLMEATPAFNIPSSSTGGYGNNYLLDFGISNGVVAKNGSGMFSFDGTNTVNTPAWIPLKNTSYKIGSRYGSTGQRNFLNGVAGTNGSFDGSINSRTNMTIGGYGGGAGYNWGGTIKNLKIYKKALTDAQIQQQTT